MAGERNSAKEQTGQLTGDGAATPQGFVPANFSAGFLDHAGPYYLKKGVVPVVVGLRIAAHHMNYRDVAHGGVLATLADVALSWAVYSSERPPLPVSTVSMATSFLGPARLGDWVEACGVIDRIGRNLAYVHGAIFCGDQTLMTMSGVYNIIRPKAG